MSIFDDLLNGSSLSSDSPSGLGGFSSSIDSDLNSFPENTLNNPQITAYNNTFGQQITWNTFGQNVQHGITGIIPLQPSIDVEFLINGFIWKKERINISEITGTGALLFRNEPIYDGEVIFHLKLFDATDDSPTIYRYILDDPNIIRDPYNGQLKRRDCKKVNKGSEEEIDNRFDLLDIRE